MLNRGTAPFDLPDGKKHILIIDRSVPDPTLDSGSVRLVEIIRLMQKMGWSVTFMADMVPPSRLGPMTIRGVQFFVDKIDHLPAWLRVHGDSMEAAWLSRFQTVLKHASLIRAITPNAGIIFDTVDLHFLREQRRLAIEGAGCDETLSLRIRDMEIHASALADTTVAISEAEAEILASIAPDSRIAVLGNIQDPIDPGRIPEFHQRSGLLFIGGMQHAPNLDALHWLSTELFAAIRMRLPHVELHIVGAISEDARVKFHADGIVFHGQIPSLDLLLSQSRISIAPLRMGAGVKGKINSAMSHGLPVVATAIAAEGMHLQDNVDVLIADDAEAFAAAVHALYHDPILWTRLSAGGLRNVERHYAAGIAEESLRRIVSERTIPF